MTDECAGRDRATWTPEKILETFYDASFGSLWWAAEDLLRLRFRDYHASDRQAHPVVSVRVKPSPFERIPMLFGTSGNQGPVRVKGVTHHKGADYVTSFKLLRPGLFTAAELVLLRENLPANRDAALSAVWQAWPNFDKPRVDDAENQDLCAYVASKEQPQGMVTEEN